MHSIVICIPTYKRPLMLKKLVLSIKDCNFNSSLIKNVDIIIVDNDIERSAEEVISEMRKDFNCDIKIDYYNMPVKGISNVRNELLKKALELKTDFIVFIDDDEYVTADWLNELVKSILNNDADAVRGPVIAKTEKDIPDYISCWFERESYTDNSTLKTLTTGNLIIKRASLQLYDVWFDNRFNIIGSGDSYFGIQLLNKGAKFCWAAKAIVYETIPESRANINWLIKRIYRGASTYSYVLKLEKRYFKIIKKIFISLIYILGGTLALIIIPVPVKKRYWGILKLSEGVGGLTGLFDMLYFEYK